MKKFPTKEENPKGLHLRYIVSKVNGDPVDENAEYFVLRLDKNGSDPNHIAACRRAIIEYAIAIREHLPQLSDDLFAKYGTKNETP
jgi:hypothetical protein